MSPLLPCQDARLSRRKPHIISPKTMWNKSKMFLSDSLWNWKSLPFRLPWAGSQFLHPAQWWRRPLILASGNEALDGLGRRMAMLNSALESKITLFIIACSNQWSNLSKNTLPCIFHLVFPLLLGYTYPMSCRPEKRRGQLPQWFRWVICLMKDSLSISITAFMHDHSLCRDVYTWIKRPILLFWKKR